MEAAQPSAAELADPVTLTATRADEYGRFMPLIKWLLAIPHYFVLFFLGIGAIFVLVFSFFAVLITGRYPQGLFNYMAGVYRWGTRVNGYVLLLTDQYPPFSMNEDPQYPVELHIDYPEAGVARWRPLLGWLLIVPYYILAGIIGIVAYFAVIFAFFTILFTKKFPAGLFEMVVVSLRWSIRTGTYGHWMTTKYPPFSWN